MCDARQQRGGATGPQLQRGSSAPYTTFLVCEGMFCDRRDHSVLFSLMYDTPHLPSQNLLRPLQEPRQGRVLAACLPPALQGEAAGSWEQLLFDQDHKGTAQHLSFA